MIRNMTEDLLEVIERAKNEGVTRMLVVGYDPTQLINVPLN